MGMGKTLQTISTILDNRPVLQHSKAGVKHPPSSPDLKARQAEEALWSEGKESWKHEMEFYRIQRIKNKSEVTKQCFMLTVARFFSN